MSRTKKPDPVKLLLSIIYNDSEAAEACTKSMIDEYGPSDYNTRELGFKNVSYYEKEMGSPLVRRFFFFKQLVDPGSLPDIKLFTNSLEAEYEKDGMRTVNLDPGYMSMGNLVLASCKFVGHRPYIRDGIYADLALIYECGTFKKLKWSYPDYASPEMIDYLNRIRQAYKEDLKQQK